MGHLQNNTLSPILREQLNLQMQLAYNSEEEEKLRSPEETDVN